MVVFIAGAVAVKIYQPKPTPLLPTHEAPAPRVAPQPAATPDPSANAPSDASANIPASVPASAPEPLPAAKSNTDEPNPAEVTDEPNRTWTSRDGRTIKAEYISATTTSVTIKRSDGIVFTLPIANLSDSDAAWIAKHPQSIQPTLLHRETTPAPAPRPQITQQQIDNIVADFPSPPSLGYSEVTNDSKQLHAKYLSMVKFIRPNTIKANLAMIRAKIDDDIKRLDPIAGTIRGNWSGKRFSGQSAAAENTILSARASISWLKDTLSSHLQAYETLVTPAE